MPAEREMRQRKANATAGYILAIFFNLVMLFVFHNLLNWGIEFVTPDFTRVLWAIDLSIGFTIASNALFLIYDARWFKYLAQVIQNILGFVVVVLLYQVFPFDFGSEFANQIARFALLLALFGLAIATVIETIRFFFGKGR